MAYQVGSHLLYETILYINSRSACVRPTRHSLRGYRTRTGTATAVRSGNLHNRRPLWCLFGHLLHFDPLLSFCICGGPGVRLSVRPVTLCVVTGPEPEPLLQDIVFRTWFSGFGISTLGPGFSHSRFPRPKPENF